MKAWLVLQEGPGAGSSYPLDPFKQTVFTLGRSGDCDISLPDKRASRHHGDIRWNGRQWEVIDRGSTNGTYVNGLQVHRVYDLRVGDRVTVGETTMVLREFNTAPPTPVRKPQQERHRGPTMEGPILPPGPQPNAAARVRSRSTPGDDTSTAAGITFWVVQGLVAAAVVCLASGAFLPWLRITASASQDLQPLVQGLVDVITSLSGQGSIFSFSQDIGGLEGYGKLTLSIAVVALITMVVDIVIARRSPIPGVVYLLSGLVATGAVGIDIINLYRAYDQIQDVAVLFGIQFADVIQLFDRLMQFQVKPLIGLPLTGIGLLVLLFAGVGRLAVVLFDRRH